MARGIRLYDLVTDELLYPISVTDLIYDNEKEKSLKYILDHIFDSPTITSPIINGGSINESDFNGGTINESKLDNVEITNSKGKTLEFEDISINSGTINESKLDNVEITNSKGKTLEFEDISINSGVIDYSTIRYSDFIVGKIKDSEINDSTINNPTLVNCTISGDENVLDGTIKGGVIEESRINDAEIYGGHGYNLELTSSEIHAPIIDSAEIGGAEIKDATLRTTTSYNQILYTPKIYGASIGGVNADGEQEDVELINPTINGGTIEADSIKVKGESGFLKADGTIDNNKYLTFHQSLSDYAKKSDVPTKVSQLTNDSKFQTKTEVDNRIQEIVGAAPEALDTLEEIADKLSDNDDVHASLINTLSEKANKSEIPTKVSQLTNDKGYLTSHQSLSDYAKKSDLNNYLPLNGGTVSNANDSIITLKRETDNTGAFIKFENNTEVLGRIGINGSAGASGTNPKEPVYISPAGFNNKLWHSGNDGSGSGLDADKLDGYETTTSGEANKIPILSDVGQIKCNGIETNTIKNRLNAVGWYRVFTTNSNNAWGSVILLELGKNYANSNSDTYLLAISIGCTNTNSSNQTPTITQLSGYHPDNQSMTKIRIVQKFNAIAYVDVYINTNSANDYYVRAIGQGKINQFTEATIPDGYKTIEFELSNGFKTNGEIKSDVGIDADKLSGKVVGGELGNIPTWQNLGRYSDVNNGDTDNTSNYKNFLRRITGSSEYGDKLEGTNFLGMLTPNSQRVILGKSYSKNPHTDGMPEHSMFLDLALGGGLTTFGTSYGEYYERKVAYTNSNVASANKLSAKQLTNEDLNTIDGSEYSHYYAAYGHSVKNVPSEITNTKFDLFVVGKQNDYVKQIIIDDSDIYLRNSMLFVGSGYAWNEWKKLTGSGDLDTDRINYLANPDVHEVSIHLTGDSYNDYEWCFTETANFNKYGLLMLKIKLSTYYDSNSFSYVSVPIRKVGDTITVGSFSNYIGYYNGDYYMNGIVKPLFQSNSLRLNIIINRVRY